ncbi:hypothetical protein KUTeg_004472 [Tegillarca granosa]|uniref:Uncharacterized protein n=1 Tax=Tegillarca granosa TaxID=220873 RepID=A0ABQ9FRL3_TEGGR|nr:hypothetical protein KUTeg_004472 [Tegillarca granosa]
MFVFVYTDLAFYDFQLYCCGVKDYKDWESNRYFNCSSPGTEACGVPFSCCKPTSSALIDRQCGYDMIRASHNSDRESYIYTIGCIPAGEKWLESNLIPVASILGICFAHNLRGDINAQISKWEYQEVHTVCRKEVRILQYLVIFRIAIL